jgi:hypothetical protein
MVAGPRTFPQSNARVKLALGILLALTFLIRLVGLDQPIVENYVGRQIPTAMVARNLERGSGFLTPCLDVLPLPNLFLVEPPLYASAVAALHRASGLALEPSGRLLSAFGMVLAAWGLFGVVARREGAGVALAAVAALAAFPVTLRYGRAFQPDALMLGFLLVGLRAWDELEAEGNRAWLALGVVATSAGLALKVISAYVLIPLVAVILKKRRPLDVWLALATLLPALVWYVHAASLLSEGGGSRASADNGAIWFRVFSPDAFFRPDTYENLVRFLCVRAFTPLGPILALAGFLYTSRSDRLWQIWGLSAFAALLVLSAKLHHEYYWLALAPVMAVGVGKALVSLTGLGGPGRGVAAAVGLALLGLSAALSASTWRTPAEWLPLRTAAQVVRGHVPADCWVVAPEALLFAADRRGCRLEFTDSAARRAAGEWGERLEGIGPLALVEFYRRKGARYFADVRPEPLGDSRLALHEAVRGRYKIMVDEPGVLLADLTDQHEGEGAKHVSGTGP